MKKSSTLILFSLILIFSGCSETKKQNENQDKEIIFINPDIEKIEKIYNNMSSRFKSEIKLSDFSMEQKNEFINDLNFVLEEEKKYNSEDLPLYFLIDKKNYAPEGYSPHNLIPLKKNDLYNISRNDLSLRPEAETALKEMASFAKSEDIKILISSSYRSYEYQKNLFDYWVKVDGLEEAERESARPGTSQHQTGFAADFGSITDDFAETEMGIWMYNNAADFGWSLSFPKNYEDITGYRWECWHFRFIGKPACQFQKKYFNNIQQYMLEFIDAWKKTK
ncbi:MAG: M15 family metallopeptidase [Treponema sp.]|nr:M15 family metallopeptidase [Treponema sp.]